MTVPLLKIQLLGAFQVTRNGEAISQFEAETARALLAYLVLHSERAHQRLALANLLWCDQPTEQSLHNLRSALNRVRKVLNDTDEAPQPIFLAERQTIQFNPQCRYWVDVVECEQLLAAVKQHAHRRLAACPWCVRRLVRLAELYQGEFLADLKVRSTVFEEWRQMQQEHLHRLAAQTFSVLSDYYLWRGAYTEAEQYARRQLVLEPWNEEAHQQLIRILSVSGQRSVAIVQYKVCRDILLAELGVAPLPATTALYDEIRHCTSSHKRQPRLTFDPVDCVWVARRKEFPNNLPASQTSFVNRQVELENLLHRLVNPANRLTTLIGEGGIGKSCLALTAARALVCSFSDGVWMTPLADLPITRDQPQAEASIVGQMVRSLNLGWAEDDNAKERLLDYLCDKEMLLLFDNFEQLLAGRQMLQELLRVAPSLTLLVTSRQRLGFHAEQVVRVPPLNLTSATQLFIERVRATCPEFVEADGQMTLIQDICANLHGNPLAIELAAAWARHHNLPLLGATVQPSLVDLATTQPDVPERHRSLHTVFQHSWRLLTPNEQHTLMGMAHMPGALAGPTAHTIPAPPSDLLADLRDKSMLVQDSRGCYQIPALLHSFIQSAPVLQ